MTDPQGKSGEGTGEPAALLLCYDLMFAVQLQNIARAEGFRPVSLRPGSAVPSEAAVLIANLADVDVANMSGPSSAGQRAWETSVREAASRGVPVIAFGPHVDADSRRAAKSAGASRVLANSNLTRDLPLILRSLRQAHTDEIIS